MFRKARQCEIKSSHVLKGSKAKELRHSVEQCLFTTAESSGPALLDSLIPKKLAIIQEKLINRAVVYRLENDDSNPLVFSLHEKDVRTALFPTLYLLWSIDPSLLIEALPNAVHISVGYMVSKPLINGADVMAPGVLVSHSFGLDRALAGSVVIVYVLGNPFPVGVGVMMHSWSEVLKRGQKGKCVQMLHVVHDALFGMGDKTVPNSAFRKKYVLPIGADAADEDALENQPEDEEEEGQEEEEVELDEPAASGDQIDSDALEQKEFPAAAQPVIDQSPAFDGGEEEIKAEEGSFEDIFLGALLNEVKDGDLPISSQRVHDQFVTGRADVSKTQFKTADRFVKYLTKRTAIKSKEVKGELCITAIHRSHRDFAALQKSTRSAVAEDASVDESRGVDDDESEVGGDAAEVSEEMEELLNGLFLKTLRNLDESFQFPVTASSFYSEVMMNLVLDENYPDVKKTRYKKMTKFFQAKTKDGLISSKMQKGNLVITSVNWNHGEVLSAPKLTPNELKLLEKKEKAKSAQPKKEVPRQKVVVLLRYKFNKQTDFLIVNQPEPEVTGDDDTKAEDNKNDELSDPYIANQGLYTQGQVKQVLNRFLQGCKVPPGAEVDLNHIPGLRSILNEKEDIVNNRVKRANLLNAVISKMGTYHAISLSSDNNNGADPSELLKFKQGGPPTIAISVKARQGRKLVTSLDGVEKYGMNPAELAPEFQRIFASSCTTKVSQEKKNTTSIQIQGDFARQVSDLLVAQFSVPQQYIKVQKSHK